MSPSAERPASISPRRLWLFRLLAVVFPLLLLIGAEFGLRWAGTGYPTSFWVSAQEKPGYVADNYRFAWRFFPRALARVPQPSVVAKQSSGNLRRIVVFGGSAAMGDPEPAYGIPRVMEALLAARFPEDQFEVVNCAVTAINSHVALAIAGDCKDNLEADGWVVYMGNNEVHGPFGAGTVFGGNGRPLWLNRLSLSLQKTRLGQFASQLRAGGDDAPQDWGGMAMFENQTIAFDSPSLDRVYGNFERNLQDLVQLCDGTETDVVVSTVATNLKDFSPFVSKHRKGITAAELNEWDTQFQAGCAAADRNQPAEAETHFAAAAAIDGDYAELAYRRGQAFLAAGEAGLAKEQFTLARDRDALRFRADTRINELIRKVAASTAVELVDAEAALASAAADGITGDAFLHEHVHLNFAGNYEIALLLVGRLAEKKGWLPGKDDVRNAATDMEAGEGWLSREECALKLGLSAFHEMLILQEMRGRLAAPPFSGQSCFAQRDRRLKARIDELRSQLTPEVGRQTLESLLRQIDARPDDWMLRRQLTLVLDSIGDLDGAAEQYREIVRIIPHHAESHFRLGALLNRQKEYEAAESPLRRALALRPRFERASNSLAICLSHLGRFEESYQQFANAVSVRPQFAEAWLNWGLVLKNQGDAAAAIGKFEEAFAADESYLPALEELAKIHVGNSDFASALPYFQQLAKQRPRDADRQSDLGVLYMKLDGHDREAREQFERALQINPAHQQATAALRQLNGQ